MDNNVYKIAWVESVRREVFKQSEVMLRNHGMTREASFNASHAVANGVMNTLLMAIIAEEIQVLKGDPDFNDFESEYPMEGEEAKDKPSPSNYPTVTAREWEGQEPFLHQGVMYVGVDQPAHGHGKVYFVSHLQGEDIFVKNQYGGTGIFASGAFRRLFRPLA